MKMKKKMFFAAIALMCCLAWTVPVFAVDWEYGGYWRTRAYTMNGFSGDGEDISGDFSMVDARARLWGVTEINESLSWTNRLEVNVIWGNEGTDEDQGGGGISTDGRNNLRIKHSFTDFTVEAGDMNLDWRVGLQRVELANGILFKDDFAGAVVSTAFGSGHELKFIWMKAFDGGTLSGEYDEDDDVEDLDVDYFGLAPTFYFMNDQLTLNAYGMLITSEDGREFTGTPYNTDYDIFFIGAEAEYQNDRGKIWGLFIYEFGEATTTVSEIDVSAYAAEIGLEQNISGKVSLHSRAFYASGDDDLYDDDSTTFVVPRGQDYNWSEIMGDGVFDKASSNGSCRTKPYNIMAANIGLSYAATDALTLTGDLWYAQLAETNSYYPEDELGTEVNLRADYMINEDLKLTLVGAYLFAGDATNYNYSTLSEADDTTDVWEVGAQLSFFFRE